ncbi:hypothetical protein N7509_009320 [Penicillium cosmopolitanum]|uniref:Rab-GAP TBC domain-containing protein n=1 Tax=Penicillium cosmopolitanum TaxID=1131564 RepID=A0A9X0B3H2_9EURO|nr:uncharacterized protein N7509_009320 [Penicillium cosmopolitanum]KAJ5386779.1 hypothetical protein N7509_009320 [Penicillium cosmopolitanum]
MRTIEETRKRWAILFNSDAPSDFRAALRTEQGGKLCNDGLRSICWKVFLLFEGLDREQWSKKLDESRDAYSALRAHFLKYIEHPDDLESSADPLADDEESPWQTLRQDEKLRVEILQDVDRCLQENYFFQEPATKSKLTDVLFIYSKLNPDVGYRQGMHELLAPILWVIDRDAITQPSESSANTSGAGDDSLMLGLLDEQFIEHDSFTLFLCVMQTARTYYEHGETRSSDGQMDVIPIVSRCDYLHKEALGTIDHELADHLQAIEVLPQIFLTRWMRLLFGREFPFDDVLMMWDVLFANGLTSDLVDFTCIAMLLRIRWELLNADYTGALSLLLRYPSPEPHEPRTFIHDALYLEQNPTAERGSFIISKYSGKEPESSKRHSQSRLRPARRAHLWDDFTTSSGSNSSTQSPNRNSPKSLESLLQDVSQGIQRRTESWGVTKAVRGAVTEARKNMQTMNYEPGLRAHSTDRKPTAAMPPRIPKTPTATELGLKAQINRLEERNQELANTLGDALKDLYLQLATVKDLDSNAHDALKQTLNRAVSVQSCLQDPSLPLPVLAPDLIPVEEADETNEAERSPIPPPKDPKPTESETDATASDQPNTVNDHVDNLLSNAKDDPPEPGSGAGETNAGGPPEARREAQRPNLRPSLSDAGFSWMLEGSRNLSSFVSSASVPPEQTRHQESPRTKGSPLFGSNGEEKPGSDAEQDELALRSLRGPL